MEEDIRKDDQLLEKLLRVQWLMHRYHQQKLREYGPMGNPYRGQGRILALLKLRPEISQKDLGYLLDMRPQSLGELLMKLERSGYITRMPSEEDKRVLNIHLTEEGEKAAEQAGQRPDHGGLFDCLSDEEQETLGVLLGRIINSLEQQLGDTHEGEGSDWRGPCGHPHGPFDPRMRLLHGRPPFGWGGMPDRPPFGHGPNCGRHRGDKQEHEPEQED